MVEPVASPWRVPFDGSFRIQDATTLAAEMPKGKALKARLRDDVGKLYELQRKLYADNRYSLLLVFQAMDAAGKDSTIRKVLSGINPAGFQIHSFKRPSSEELDHDFLWRSNRRLPERGRIGVFNRSYYEEVLVVRVHPGILDGQRIPRMTPLPTLWEERFESISQMEQHLARNGTIILKFWLNVSREEQKRRFLARLDDPHKHWKFDPNDLRERALWDDYMQAYEQALAATSRDYAPWYAIPADNKPFMRAEVASILRRTLESLALKYPEMPEDEKPLIDEYRNALEQEQQSAT